MHDMQFVPRIISRSDSELIWLLEAHTVAARSAVLAPLAVDTAFVAVFVRHFGVAARYIRRYSFQRRTVNKMDSAMRLPLLTLGRIGMLGFGARTVTDGDVAE